MEKQKFRVGQTVRVEDVHEGVVTRVRQDGIYVDNLGRLFRPAPGMTRTITILSEPKPDEPTMLGAVVRDRDGNVWVLVRYMDGRHLWHSVATGYWMAWKNVDAVEVLFPGVEEKP